MRYFKNAKIKMREIDVESRRGNNLSDDEIMDKIKIGKFTFPPRQFSKVSKDCQEFISQCLTLDPNKRPTAAKLIKHKWIQKEAKYEVEEE